MSGKKVSAVKKAQFDSEFEMLLRQTAKFMKTRGPQLVRKSGSTHRTPAA